MAAKAGGSVQRKGRGALQPVGAPAPRKDGADTPLIGHNSGLQTEANEARYRNLMAQHREVDGRIERHKATGKELTADRKGIRSRLVQMGFTEELIDENLADRLTSRTILDRKETVRSIMREWDGMPAGPPIQGDLLKNTPDFVKGELQWDAEGYMAGVNGLDRSPPVGCSPEMQPAFDKGWLRGQERLAWAQSEDGKIVDRDPDVGAGGATPLDDEPAEEELTPAQLRAKEAALARDAKKALESLPARDPGASLDDEPAGNA